MKNPAEIYLESSFLAPLLKKVGVTDISFNGESLFFMCNQTGREKAMISVTASEVGAFLRQIANLSEKQFSFASPLLDVSFGPYRLNAVYSSLVRVRNERSFSFSLRLESGTCRLEDDSAFFGKGAEPLLLQALEKQESIVIGGVTSSGKTELQKWLLLHFRPATRVIVIDNVEELDMVKNEAIDMTTWLVDAKNPEGSFEALVRNSLRNDPDYVMLAESRGREMLDALQSAMGGHPIITTIHAKTLAEMPARMAKMALRGHEGLTVDDLLDDIAHHFENFVYLRKTESKNGIERFIETMGRLNPGTGKMQITYRRGEKA